MQSDRTYFEFRPERDYVYLKRTAEAYPSTAFACTQLRRMAEVLDPYRKKSGLLLDLRDARGRNDPDFEAQTRGLRGGLVRGFERAAMLVGSAAGKLQVRRHMVEDGFPDVLVTTDESEAMAFLRLR